MSKIISQAILIGDKQLSVNDKTVFVVEENSLNLSEATIVKFRRSLSKDGLMALSCLEMARKLIHFNFDRTKTGIYGAFLQGPFLNNLVDQTEHNTFSEAYDIYRLNTPPKQVFKQNSAVKTTHLAMTLQTNGPQMTFVSPTHGLIDALNTAEVDLYLGEIKTAVVIASFSIEENQVLQFYQNKSEDGVVHEAAICLILEKDEKFAQYELGNSDNFSFGIGSPYIQKNLRDNIVR